MHALLCGLKVLVSTHGVSDRSMGSHGYSTFTGVGHLYIDYLPSVTFEVDNFVLDGQVIRAATKLYNAVLSSTSAVTKLLPPSAYLHLLSANSTPPHELGMTSQSVIFLLEYRAALVVKNFPQTQVNDTSEDAKIGGRLYRLYLLTPAESALVDLFLVGLIHPMGAGDPTQDLHLYSLTTAEGALVYLFSVGLIHPTGAGDPTHDLRLAIKALCLEILPNAGLTDAFGFLDWSLDSALGVSDGRVYEAVWQRVQMEPMNKDQVTPAYAV
ncbi:hypothetical protein AZE42_12679, partial [Rhizopogon vesiculosus]